MKIYKCDATPVKPALITHKVADLRDGVGSEGVYVNCGTKMLVIGPVGSRNRAVLMVDDRVRTLGPGWDVEILTYLPDAKVYLEIK